MEIEASEQVGTTLLLENESVKVWELAVAPGESLAKHIHRHNYIYIVSSGGLLRFAEDNDPERYRDVQFTDNQVAFVEAPEGGKIDNTLTNIGNKAHRNYIIELKKVPPSGA